MSQPKLNEELSPLEIKFGWGLVLIQIFEAITGFLLYFIFFEIALIVGGIIYLISGSITLIFFLLKRRAFKMPHNLGPSLFLIIILVFCLFIFEMLISQISLFGAWHFFGLFIPWIGYMVAWIILSQVQKKNK